MQFYKTLEKNYIECLLCGHSCKIAPEKSGICKVNLNQNGKLKSLNFNTLSALNIDPIEKKPLYHVKPNSTSLSIGGYGCNFTCDNCQNHDISQTLNYENSPFIDAISLSKLAVENNCQSISFTYNEPSIFYPFAKEVMKEAKKQNLLGIFVTNGFMSEEIIYDMQVLIDALNVDLKSFNKQIYRGFKGDLHKILDNLVLLKKLGFWVEITTLIINDFNDTENELRKIANFIATNLDKNTPWHISAFHPAYKMQKTKTTTSKSLNLAYEIGKNAGLNFVYIGNIGHKNITFCPQCKFELIIRKAYQTNSNLNQSKCPNCNENLAGIY